MKKCPRFIVQIKIVAYIFFLHTKTFQKTFDQDCLIMLFDLGVGKRLWRWRLKFRTHTAFEPEWQKLSNIRNGKRFLSCIYMPWLAAELFWLIWHIHYYHAFCKLVHAELPFSSCTVWLEARASDTACLWQTVHTFMNHW